MQGGRAYRARIETGSRKLLSWARLDSGPSFSCDALLDQQLVPETHLRVITPSPNQNPVRSFFDEGALSIAREPHIDLIRRKTAKIPARGAVADCVKSRLDFVPMCSP